MSAYESRCFVTDYSALDRLLHRLALQVTPVAAMSFDLDQRRVKRDPQEIVQARHVFVSGLARAGTTVLMRQFHASGAYRSLTYRDMPFVLAPNLWRALSQTSKRDAVAAERAHGDGLLVDFDSPESLDEVFWHVFAGESYLHKTYLTPHEPDADLVRKYVCYVNAILSAQAVPGSRYLSKNNNNLLRLGAIRQAFPQALILIPFRQPLAQAASLLRQHRNFLDLQAADRFARAYMTWLAHHEFGRDHRPFRFDETQPRADSLYDTDGLDYWLEGWCRAYDWLARCAPEDAVFVCYEDLCDGPSVPDRLADLAGLPTLGGAGAFVAGAVSDEAARDSALAARARDLYERLVERARRPCAE
ncbi:MAG: sulfotransferase [Rhodospirillales bacterium]